jgi:hypothetical protein
MIRLLQASRLCFILLVLAACVGWIRSYSKELTLPRVLDSERFGSFTLYSHRGTILANSEVATITFQFWQAIAVFFICAGPCSLILHRLSLRIRHDNGVCERCGYDLRATPNRCPECGKIVC